MTPASEHDDTVVPATTTVAQAPPAPAFATSPAQQQQPPLMKRHLRTMTSTEEIDSTINRPGSVKINVQGAFIVDPDTSTPASGGGGATAVAAAAHANANANNGRVSPSSHPETSDIRLPNHTAVVSHIAIDIGGSLAKLVYFSREVDSTDPGGRLNFQNFETDRIDDCLEYMRHLRDNQLMLNGSQPGELCVMATGGGAYKFYDKIREALGVNVNVLREDEMECLIIGLDFFITEIPREVFTYSESDPMQFVPPRDNIYPYLLVNIGSGVSFLKVTGPRSYQRVGGTSLGGGTLWGLLSMLTGARTFDEMLDLAGHGDNAKVDMLVGDIYGTDYGKIGLKSTTIASSFGKVFRMKREAESAAEDSPVPHDSESSFSGADVSRSLLYAISNNIGQIAYLQSQIHSLSNIYFGGSFIRGHRQTINTLSYAIKFWSQGEKQAYFLRHEGYLGSVGAFLKRQPRNWGRRGSLEGMEEMSEWRRSQREAEVSASTA
ncbi:fumble-domain-containing protein [Dactylonectria estremocensis]|uniref:Fumble-domain-containing protein n=1 Tax=Dactylonectria estremocensis TaxID=1079267 RepID=A0A9P9FCY4_9HYPO|nr:fumble-domain-containing protein [Dactylonectria estremocensis]